MRPVRASTFIVLLSVLAGTLSGCGGPVPPATTGASSPTAAASPRASAPSRAGTVVAHVPVGSQPDGLTWAAGSVWVACGDGTVTRIDPTSRRVLASVPAGAGAIAVVGDQHAVWVANYDAGSVTRIDPASNTVTSTVPVGTNPVGLALVGDRLWVADQGDSALVELDARSGRHLRTVQVGAGSGFLTLGDGAIWVPDFSGTTRTLLRVDPVSGRTTARVPVGAGPINASIVGSAGWTSNTGDATVTRFDAVAGTRKATVRVSGGSLGPVLATPDAVWVSVYAGGSVVRIDPSTDAVVGRVATGQHPQNLIDVAGDIWVAEGGADDVAIIRPAAAP